MKHTTINNKTKLISCTIRDYSFDNMKTFAIFCVVFSHIILYIQSDVSNSIYKLIFSFHMPLFIYISGFFSKFNIKKILSQIVLPYATFQLAYFLFEFYYLGTPITSKLYLQPNYIMWYMFCLIFWRLSIIVLNKIPKKLHSIVVILTFLLGLYIGLKTNIGYKFSLSRMLTLYPFFVLGYFHKQDKPKIKNKTLKIILKVFIVIAVTIAAYLTIKYQNKIDRYWYFGSYAYSKKNYTREIRFLIYIVALVWIMFFRLFTSKQPNFWTAIGERTLWIYIMHGFIVKILRTETYLAYLKYPIISCFAITLLMLVPFTYNNKFPIVANTQTIDARKEVYQKHIAKLTKAHT